MDVRLQEIKTGKSISALARLGLIAKGIVYVLLGVLAFMAAFEIGGQSSEKTDKAGVLYFLNHSSGGKWLLPLLAAGLLCYSLWRFTEAFRCASGGHKDWKNSARYFFSGFIYLLLSFSAFNAVFASGKKNEDSQQAFASQVLSKPLGQWLLGIIALAIAGVGVYQLYYALSEKYKKHVQKMNLHDRASSLMLTAGKTGYIARGVVWLIIAYLMLQAAFRARSSEAGDTGKAFALIEHSPMGSYLLGALGIGLVAYGLFSFIRARYERFE